MKKLDVIKTIYGNELGENNYFENYSIVEAPDFIIEGAGDYCGDKLDFRIRVIKNNIEIEPISSACVITEKSLSIMLAELKEKSLQEQLEYCKYMIDFIENENDFSVTCLKSLNSLAKHRKDCIILPWKLMEKSLETAIHMKPELSSQPQIIRGNSLDCEACVSANYIGVTNKEKEETKKSNVNVLLSVIDTPDKDLDEVEKKIRKISKIYPRRFGKLILTQEELDGLSLVMKNWDDDFVLFYSRNKTANIIAKHIGTLNFKIPDKLQECIEKESHKRKIVDETYTNIERILKKNNVTYYGVKGIATSKYYEGVERYYGDIDIMVPDMASFFKAFSLIREDLKFDYCSELGKMCSVKCYNSEMISGHGHVDRFIDGEMITIDIGYPCIPADNNRLVKVGDFKNYYTDNLFIIALAHAFKHARPPIKDINDCYLMIVNKKINYNYITNFLVENKMEIKYYALCRILEKYYNLQTKNISNYDQIKRILTLKERKTVAELIKCGWPFSKIAQRLFQYTLFKKGKKEKIGNQIIDNFFATEARVYFIPVLRTYSRWRITEEIIDKLSKKYGTIVVIADGIYGISVSEQKYVVVDHSIFVCRDGFNVKSDLPYRWIENAIHIANEFTNDYRICLYFDDKLEKWDYR